MLAVLEVKRAASRLVMMARRTDAALLLHGQLLRLAAAVLEDKRAASRSLLCDEPGRAERLKFIEKINYRRKS